MGMLLAYDASGAVVATLDYSVVLDADGHVVGMWDFEATESAGPLTAIWTVSNASGSGTWPEYLGQQAHAFRAIRGSDGRIAALIHKTSGFRRDRAAIQAAIAAAPVINGVKDLRAIVGGPNRPIPLLPNGQDA